ncbi:MAG: hypothetical protein M1834_000930 [Cirrosporium novae-zelandiae]|nr:MAG: hypothetical protein M1834_000930 [Cirrosporium novae-zelandiae]
MASHNQQSLYSSLYPVNEADGTLKGFTGAGSTNDPFMEIDNSDSTDSSCRREDTDNKETNSMFKGFAGAGSTNDPFIEIDDSDDSFCREDNEIESYSAPPIHTTNTSCPTGCRSIKSVRAGNRTRRRDPGAQAVTNINDVDQRNQDHANGEWEIREVINKRVKRDGRIRWTEYLVRWHSTWVSADYIIRLKNKNSSPYIAHTFWGAGFVKSKKLMEGNKVFYYLKWKPTWVRAELVNAPNLVATFEVNLREGRDDHQAWVTRQERLIQHGRRLFS